jgi:hypothetical protein
MRGILRLIGASAGAFLGAALGVVIARALIRGQLAGAPGWLLVFCSVMFVSLLVGGGWLGSKIA